MKLGYGYSNNLLQRVSDANGTTVFWQATSTDAWGHIQDETFGNGVVTFTDFDQASGLMTSRAGGLGGGTGLIDARVAWDLNGNLSERTDLKLSPAVTETFTYDSLNRFDFSQRNGVTNADVTLNAIGNITWKQGVGNYSYHATQKRAVVSAGSSSFGYDANGNMTSRNGSTISYTSYNLPSSISAGSNSSTITYGAYRNRYKQVAVTSGTTETTLYVGGLLEKMTRGSLVKWRHLIHGGNGLAAVYTRRSGSASNTDTAYLHRDHLGSPELLTSHTGALIARSSFGAYGERRDGSDWNGPPSAAELTTLGNYRRDGFTGHEHLDAVGLIHMNGRVYEPVAGRFLSVDPILHTGNSQSPNSYAYVWNNPLTLVDPSGFDAVPVRRCYWNFDDCVDIGDWGLPGSDPSVPDRISRDPGSGNQPGSSTPRSIIGPQRFLTSFGGSRVIYGIARHNSVDSIGQPTANIAGVIVVVGGAILAIGGAIDQLDKALDRLSELLESPVSDQVGDVTYVTYVLYDPESQGYYYGRTKGVGSAAGLVARRFGSHHVRLFHPRIGIHRIDESRIGPDDRNSFESMAIRGREQQLIDRGKRRGETVLNKINGIYPFNLRCRDFHNAANAAFGGSIAPANCLF